jgi:RNA polymerase sigma factor (sigma-70 family)
MNSRFDYDQLRRLVRANSLRVAVTSSSCPEHPEDLEQEIWLELWRKRSRFDARRASWRTFAERVAANRVKSLMRARLACRRRVQLEPLESAQHTPAPHNTVELRGDVVRVLSTVSDQDRAVALSLAHSTPAEVGPQLQMSRASVYRSIWRLREAFIASGLFVRDNTYTQEVGQ